MPTADEPLLATLGFIAAAVLILVDGRNAVSIAALVAGVCLAPAVAESTGTDAALVLICAGAGAVIVGPASRVLARRVNWMAGLDPVVPVVSTEESLFGPRSIRVACGVAVLPAASWVSFNVPVGSATTVTGILFPAAIVWGCAAVRVLVARTVIDVAVGVAGVGVAGAAAWLAAAGADQFVGAIAAGALAPAMALVAGWLSGRHAAAGQPV